jgi:hypothetical protein
MDRYHLWGVLLTGFGLVSAAPARSTWVRPKLAAHDVIFLIAGGLLTCLIGITGLMGFMGWIPGLQKEEEMQSNVRHRTECGSNSPILDSRQTDRRSNTEDTIMLYTIAVVLIILWLLGLVTSYTIGGFIHILLVVAVIMILVRLISGRGI